MLKERTSRRHLPPALHHSLARPQSPKQQPCSRTAAPACSKQRSHHHHHHHPTAPTPPPLLPRLQTLPHLPQILPRPARLLHRSAKRACRFFPHARRALRPAAMHALLPSSAACRHHRRETVPETRTRVSERHDRGGGSGRRELCADRGCGVWEGEGV